MPFALIAAGFTATVPTLCWLLAQRCPSVVRSAAAVMALALGTVVAVALVRAGEHTSIEAAAGWIVGMAAFVCTVHLASEITAPPVGVALPGAAVAFVTTAWALRTVSVGYWMIRLATALSGNPYPHPWSICG